MPVNKKTMTLVAMAVAIVGGLLAVAVNHANERRFRALEREVRTTAAERDQSEGAEASRRPIVIWAPPPSLPPQPVPAAATTAANDPPPAEPRIPSEAEYAVSVNTAFSEEVRDVSWAQDTERSISASLRGVAGTSVVETVECRRNLCRASLRHPDQEKFSEFIDRIIARANETWTGEVYSYREAVGSDGAVQSTMYFGKPGASIHSLALAEIGAAP
jgi:hypothetical protein